MMLRDRVRTYMRGSPPSWGLPAGDFCDFLRGTTPAPARPMHQRTCAIGLLALASPACHVDDPPTVAPTSTASSPPVSQPAPTSPPARAAMSPATPARPTPAPALVSVIVAQGLMGRTTISCDEGKTWVLDRSF